MASHHISHHAEIFPGSGMYTICECDREFPSNTAHARHFIREMIAEYRRPGGYGCDLTGLVYDSLPDPPCEACPLWDGDCDVELRASLLGWTA